MSKEYESLAVKEKKCKHNGPPSSCQRLHGNYVMQWLAKYGSPTNGSYSSNQLSGEKAKLLISEEHDIGKVDRVLKYNWEVD